MSGKRPFGWVALSAILVLFGQAQTGWAGDDFQVWETLELKKRVGNAWELFFLPEVRIRDDASDLFYHEYRQGVRFKPSKHLTLGLNHLFVRNESSGKPRDEQTGELDVTPRAVVGPLELSLRGRVALRTIQGSAAEQEFQIRLMPKIAYPTQWAGRKVSPYLANDSFYDYPTDAWNQQRTYLGVVIPLKEWKGVASSIDLYYMAQSQRSARKDWSTNHVLGTKLIVRF